MSKNMTQFWKKSCIYRFSFTFTYWTWKNLITLPLLKNKWKDLGDLQRPRSWYPSLAILNKRLSCVGGKVTPLFFLCIQGHSTARVNKYRSTFFVLFLFQIWNPPAGTQVRSHIKIFKYLNPIPKMGGIVIALVLNLPITSFLIIFSLFLKSVLGCMRTL